MRGAPPSNWEASTTDNLSVPNKYALPSGYLAAGDWTFYWLDNDPEQGPFHAPFTLSASGDEIALLEWDDAGGFWIILDFFAFELWSSRTFRWAAIPTGPTIGSGSPPPRPMRPTTTPSFWGRTS